MIKSIKKFFIPFVALMLAMAMLFSVACQPGGNDNGDNGDNGGGNNEQPGGDENPDGENPDGDENGGQPGVTYTVTFMVDDEVFGTQEVNSGETATAPTPAPKKDGEMFTGWYESLVDTVAYDFAKPVTSALTLYAKFAIFDAEIKEAGAYNESLYVVFEESNPEEAMVEYSLAGGNNWTKVDAPLIRSVSSTEARVDILGLAAGSYNVKITMSNGQAIQLPAAVTTTAYDRSGYAHFNYTKGIGAYENDGALKEGALVIYVTDKNKNDVLDYAYVNGEKVDISQYMVASSASVGVTVGQQTGIGELLNNRRYSGNDRMNVGIAKLSQVYGAVVIRIIGTVSAEISGTMGSSINGLTDYNSTGNGGSVGDNGRMARMVNAHDITIEGVGEDSVIFGWGVHFIASDAQKKYERAGESFEVRNLTFENYPEDAIGMEGLQGTKWDDNGSITSGASSTSADLPSPVQRCWIHNNTFLPGYAKDPAESDKAEGDGSCDFKRGMYYTLSYNYFTDCHKTNLIGSSDSSLQFYITMHHNWWNNCGSRIPLVRNSNVHFYNNYVFGDMSATPKPDLSYVVSARGSAYLFSEANYFDGTKNVVKEGDVKSYNDVFYADFGTNVGTKVTDRAAAVSNKCRFEYRNIDFTHFDTDSDLFYYKDGLSDCLLDDAVTARQKVMMYAGANGHGVTQTNMNLYTPTATVPVGENGITISLPASKGDTDVSGVMFRGLTGASSGTIKFKGQGVTFTLASQAQLTVTTTSSGDPAPELIGADGTVYAHKFEGTLVIVLEPGTYVIASGQKEKEAYISALRFDDTAASSGLRMEAAVEAITAIPATAALTEEYETALKAAQSAYNALTTSEKSTFGTQHADLVAKLDKAISDYGKLQVENVKALISGIGTVNKNSYDAINAAQKAYDALTNDQKAQLTAEKATLDAAWAAYEQYAVQNVIDMITAFVGKVNALGNGVEKAAVVELVAESDAVQTAYDLLTDASEDGPGQKSQVTNYAEFVTANNKLGTYASMFDFLDALEYFKNGHEVTFDDAAQVSALIEAYNGMTAEQQNALSAEDKALYAKVLADFNAAKPNIIYAYFTRTGGNSGDPVINTNDESNNIFSFIASCSGGNDGGTITTTDGQTVTVTNGLKMESKTEFGINLGSAGTATVKFYMAGSNGVTINGTAYSATNKIVTVTGLSGNLIVTRNSSDTLLYVEVIYN